MPNDRVSEHPPALVADGPGVRDEARQRGRCASPDWSSTAIFLAWDDWGGFYDHVDAADGRRATATACACPGIVISPYAQHGYIDHQTLSFDAYAKFIEDDFLGGQRLDPTTDGRPDPRPDVRENAADPRQPRERLRLHADAAPAADPAALPPRDLRGYRDSRFVSNHEAVDDQQLARAIATVPSAEASRGCRRASRVAARMRLDVRQREVVRLAPAEDVLAPERHASPSSVGRLLCASLTRLGSRSSGMSVRTLCSTVCASDSKFRSTRQRIELVGKRAQEAALPRHPRVVVRVLARPHVGERLVPVEVVRAARIDVDPRLRLAPRRTRDGVVQSFLHVDRHAAERVDEIGEAAQVHEGVVVDAHAEQLRHGQLERARAGVARGRQEVGVRADVRVEPVDRLVVDRQLAADANVDEVSRDPERGSASRPVLERDEDDRVRARAPVAGAFVGAEEQDRRPRALGGGRSAPCGEAASGLPTRERRLAARGRLVRQEDPA